jgi:hypothetical protein
LNQYFLFFHQPEKASKMGCLPNPIPNVSIEKRNRDGTSNVALRLWQGTWKEH